MRGTSATGRGSVRLAILRCARRGGFTLIELMVVLAIMVLMAASLPLALNRMLPARRVTVAADALVANIRWLQARSAQTGHPARLSLTQSGYELAGYELATQPGAAARKVILATSTTLRLRASEDGRSVTHLTIYPDGTSAAGRFEILDSGRRAVVEISMLTGRARRTG